MEQNRKQITFDLSQKALKENYPHPKGTINQQFYKKAYEDISNFMKSHGFEHRQYSVYTSVEAMTSIELGATITLLAQSMPWIANCVNEMDVTNIGEQFSLIHVIQDAVKDIDVKLPQKEESMSKQTARSSIREKLKDARAKANQINKDRVKELPLQKTSKNFPER